MREWCWKHQIFREPSLQCPHCAAEAAEERRDTIAVLLDRVADQAAAIEILRRRVAGLERRLQEPQS